MGRPDIGGIFLNECVDIVERGRVDDIQIEKVSIEGVYGGEIFRFSYTPKEEGYGTEEGEAIKE
jgi:hypothetical protein